MTKARIEELIRNSDMFPRCYDVDNDDQCVKNLATAIDKEFVSRDEFKQMQRLPIGCIDGQRKESINQ